MADMISRAAAHEMVKGLQKWCITLPGNPRITQVGYMSDDVRFGLDRLPAVDAAPVVRCKDCKHSYFASNRVPDEQCLGCGKHGIDVTDDWYCAYGERRESE